MTSNVVLVAEDEPLVLLDVEISLAKAGFEVVSAKNGSQALAALTPNQHASRR